MGMKYIIQQIIYEYSNAKKQDKRIRSVLIQKVRFSKKFDIFGGQFNETCKRFKRFQ